MGTQVINRLFISSSLKVLLLSLRFEASNFTAHNPQIFFQHQAGELDLCVGGDGSARWRLVVLKLVLFLSIYFWLYFYRYQHFFLDSGMKCPRELESHRIRVIGLKKALENSSLYSQGPCPEPGCLGSQDLCIEFINEEATLTLNLLFLVSLEVLLSGLTHQFINMCLEVWGPFRWYAQTSLVAQW